jgi:hypothetical protein
LCALVIVKIVGIVALSTFFRVLVVTTVLNPEIFRNLNAFIRLKVPILPTFGTRGTILKLDASHNGSGVDDAVLFGWSQVHSSLTLGTSVEINPIFCTSVDGVDPLGTHIGLGVDVMRVDAFETVQCGLCDKTRLFILGTVFDLRDGQANLDWEVGDVGVDS